MGDLETTTQFDSEVAKMPKIGPCCVQSNPLQRPDLNIPEIIQEMNYGCGKTVHPLELIIQPTVLDMGVGGGLEALQCVYFSRRGQK